MIRRITYSLIAVFIFCLPWAQMANARSHNPSHQRDQSAVHNPEVRHYINRLVKHYKFSRSYLQHIFARVYVNHRVIKDMQKPYEAEPWYNYKKYFVTENRIKNGVKFWQRNRKFLAWAHKEYGIPANIIVAILGIESKYGKKMGTIRVIDSLTTLAFYYPRRQKFFRKELTEFLLLARQNQWDPLAIRGSYAGALGMPQFMPSSYLTYGVDFHGKPKADLFHDASDAIFSVANYLRQHGWEPNQPIAVPAEVDGQDYKKVLKPSRKPHAPQHTLATLEKYGIHCASRHMQASLRANLMEFKGENGPLFWLGLHNFYVITRYNNSDLYALAVYTLGQKIKATREKQAQEKNGP